jgi:hypothetical protein
MLITFSSFRGRLGIFSNELLQAGGALEPDDCRLAAPVPREMHAIPQWDCMTPSS